MSADSHLITDALAVAHAAADAAARIHRGHVGARLDISTKSSATDLVTEVDRLSETAIRAVIGSHFPNHTILGEEAGEAGAESAYRWIVDPLDGTVNYAHGFPFYSVSIALEVAGAIELGVVVDTAHGERFAAARGRGASLNGVPIRVSETRSLGESMLATGFAYGGEVVAENLALFAKLLPRTRAIRRPGSAALDLCMVACGRFDGFWELKLNAWDVAAGMLLVQEAGGTVTGPHGAPYRFSDHALIASNGHLHAALSDALGLGLALA
jgi:myo-inositol-1(or 4)-monophosphatase